MTHRERLETAWAFREPDRVPVELEIAPRVREHPKARRLVELLDEHADNFLYAPSPAWGFLGLPSRYSETVVEDRPSEYRRVRRVHETAVGEFVALTYHPAGQDDFHWLKRFVATVDDLARLADAPREPAPWDREAYAAAVERSGDAALPLVGLLHPLGALVRNATMEEAYAWMVEERGLLHRFLAAANDQVAATVERVQRDQGAGLSFVTAALEMLIPPWIGARRFDELVFPYDQRVNQAIHRGGGRLRAHCHGNCMDFLARFADMGIDAVEPLEPPPFGNVDLAEARRRVGGRMLLSGNIASQDFVRTTPDEVRFAVRQAIGAAAPGGGFTLRTTGGQGGTSVAMSEEILERVLENCEAYLRAGLECGRYPIRL